MSNHKPIYLDNSATTATDPDVLSAMLPYFTGKFGNAGSRNHSFGWDAEEAVELARQEIAKSINTDSKYIVFTSGATESNNIAIKGAAEYMKRNKGKSHVITLETEHKCVLESCNYLAEHGFDVSYLPVKSNGLVDLDVLVSAITSNTCLVSIAWVHNEIGVVQNIEEISKICRDRGVLLHTDAAQALGKVKVDAKYVDLLSISGHKMYAPKGIGALYIGKGVRLERIISGGGQEKGIRSGTLPVPLCVGLGKAAVLAEANREEENIRIKVFRDYMLNRIMTELPEVSLNGDLDMRVPHNLSLNFACVEGESLMMYLNGIAVSSGSACTSGSLEPSYVVSALGTPIELVHTAIRIVFGRYNTMDEVKTATNRIIQSVNQLRAMSPLWEMHQKGVDITKIQWTG